MQKLAQSAVDSIAKNIAGQLTIAWNNRSGEQFARQFTGDAVFVNVYGEILHSRVLIAKGHQFILDHAFKEVKNTYELIDAVQIDENTILSHNKGTMPHKDGGLTMTLVIINQSGEWMIRALHNTTTSINPFTQQALNPNP
jgi:uncharacterized protein (TIGR02246 family)